MTELSRNIILPTQAVEGRPLLVRVVSDEQCRFDRP